MGKVIAVGDQDTLVAASAYPKYAQFPFDRFNPVQSRVFEHFDKDCNVVIAACTAAGKTAAAEMVMAHEIRVRGGKAMYLAPMRALAKEKIGAWSAEGHHFSDLKLSICTGDYRLTPERKQELDASGLILMTSEMLLSRCRNYKSENNEFLSQVGTMVVDECFVAETLVRVDQNIEVPIKKVAEDPSITHVMSFDGDTRQVLRKKIVRKLTKPCKGGLVSVRHEFGHFACTKEHKIWTEGGYRKAGELTSEDVLKWIPTDSDLADEGVAAGDQRIRPTVRNSSDNHASRVVSVENRGDPQVDKVYDLEVEDTHNYFANGTLVSNCHILGVPSRGDHQEVGLMKFSQLAPHCRIVALSATLPNVDEIAEWLCHLNGKDTVLVRSSYRPCPLGTHFETYWPEGTYDATEAEKVRCGLQIVEEHPEDKFLCFAHTKRTGEMMLKAVRSAGFKAEFHFGDLERDKRHEIETKFRGKELDVLVATSTLAWGCCRAGTPVTMADGTEKGIERVVAGDEVLSWDENTGGFAPGRVVKAGEITNPASVRVTLGSGRTVEVACNHRFRATVMGAADGEWKGERWVEAVLLREGDYLWGMGADREPVRDVVLGVEVLDGGTFYDIEVENTHTYLSAGVVSHNCNTPARRVVILGVHRGTQLVESYDIIQEVGRAGRPGYDPRGDAYILLPEPQANEHMARIRNPGPIRSRLLDAVGHDKPHYKTLAFHLVSEIHHGAVRNREELDAWYARTLASFQDQDLDPRIVGNTVDLLVRCGAVKVADGEYSVTPVGTVSSLFYYSPFDVADLRRNFHFLFQNRQADNDLMLSVALGNVDTLKGGIVSRAERFDMARYAAKVKMVFDDAIPEAAVKACFAYYSILTGAADKAMSVTGLCRTLQSDFQRLAQVLHALDSMAGKWEQREFIRRVQTRVFYGVPDSLVDLCSLADVGKVRSERLFAAGIRSSGDVVDNAAQLPRVLNLPPERCRRMVEAAKARVLVGG